MDREWSVLTGKITPFVLCFLLTLKLTLLLPADTSASDAQATLESFCRVLSCANSLHPGVSTHLTALTYSNLVQHLSALRTSKGGGVTVGVL